MEEPIKVIWKYKNNNRRVQYGIYIYVGPVNNAIKQILNKMENLSFYDTLVKLNQQEHNVLIKKYGEKWYKYFFNYYHLNNTINLIKDTSSQKKEIINIFGQKWYDEHIDSYKLIEKKLIYSYEALIKDENDRKTLKKKEREFGADDDFDFDYTTTKTNINKLGRITKTKKYMASSDSSFDSDTDDSILTESLSDLQLIEMTGGAGTIHNKNCICGCHKMNLNDNYNYNEDENEYEDKYEDENNNYNENENGKKNMVNKYFQLGGENDEIIENDNEETDETQDDDFEEGESLDDITTDEEIDLEEIEQIYKDIDIEPDKNLNQTSNLIQKALNDENLFTKQQAKILDFDTSKDNDGYDENLKDVYTKRYVMTQYIFKDDSIKMIKNKICCGFKNNPKFGKDFYILPSRQYLWTEYVYNDKIEKVMIGQKWVRKSEILHVDIEPSSNISIYEELRGNLKILRDNLKRVNKIKWENDENNILYDYDGYFTNNEIYMVDIYNELGQNYNTDSESLKNIVDVYMQLYFKRIKGDDIKYILESLSGESKTEASKIETTFETIYNDLYMENEIMNVVEEVKENDKYKGLFKENFITQSVIHVNLRIDKGRIDLFRIFNDFIPTDKYPFIQYQTPDGQIIFKFRENEIYTFIKTKENMDVMSKWFENAPYGISFKIKIMDNNNERFIAINLNESGRIEYKTQWKEEDNATINDIKKTYVYVYDLLKELNNENKRLSIIMPDESEFKYAFINTIQKFELPEKFIINHNDLSEFSRFFYPYVSLVIEPRKRQAKIQKGDDKGKFGTYLRFKRVSKYDNPIRIEQRIMYFMRNYEYNDTTLVNEISKQFNITEDKAFEEIERVRAKYPHLRKSRKILKKLENIPKYKPPGIGIDIQGKTRDKYKIRISGARDKQQLDRIINFINILMYLYAETYLYKKAERQNLKEKLKKLTNIAKRRNMVEELVDYTKEVKTIKQMAQIDKFRIGNKPEKGQHNWSRDCQNSGKTHRRRPQLYNSSNMGDMIKKGYKYNKKTGEYERHVMLKNKNGKKQELILKSLRLPELDAEGKKTNDEIHYTCSPNDNGVHMYVGFLSRSITPNGYCLPCCFKKDPALSSNKDKQELLKKCMGNATDNKKEVEIDEKEHNKILGEKLYILQDTNKIQEGRFGFLPKYLDFYFNLMLKKDKTIKHHYLTKTKSGYFFKYGSKQDEFQFLNCISSIIGLSVNDIKKRIIDTLLNDTDQIFTSLNNGDIRTQFRTKEAYIEYIKYSNNLDYDIINSILSIPKVIINTGLNIVIFNKKIHVIKKILEKETTKEDFYLNCQDYENHYNITDPKRETIFILKENKNYYPIVLVDKEDEDSKIMNLTKTFNYENKKDNIVNHVLDFYKKNCFGSFLDDILYKNKALTAKDLYNKLILLEKDFHPRYQIIDVRNKCKNIITYNGLVLPVRASGSIYNLQIIKQPDKYFNDFKGTIKLLNKIYDESKKEINMKPIGVFYDGIKNKDYNVIAVMTQTHDSVEIIPEYVSQKVLDDMGLIYENKPLYDKIDKDIQSVNMGKNNKTDDRISVMGNERYTKESYELFRMEFSEFINKDENAFLKKKFESYMTSKKMNFHEKIIKIRVLLYKLIDKTLLPTYEKIIKSSEKIDMFDDINDIDDNDENDENEKTTENSLSDKYKIKRKQKGGKTEKLVYVLDKKPDTSNYSVNNDRSICKTLDKNTCSTNIHCHWSHSGCLIALTEEMIITFVNKISNELAMNELRAMEIMRYENYFVSDIVDFTRFTERDGQKIIKSSSNSIKKVLHDIFGKDNVPKIGKRRIIRGNEMVEQEMNDTYPLKELKDMMIQPIMQNNLTIFRAYVNCYYWLTHPFYDIENRNLGYYSISQTDLANYFKSIVIEWLTDIKNKKEIEEVLIPYMNIKKTSKNVIDDFTTKLGHDTLVLTNCIVELYVINKIQHIPIVVYNNDNDIIYVFDDGIIYDKNKKSNNKLTKYENDKNKIINMRFNFISGNMIPDDIDAIYFTKN